jgi:hypothetical protein
MLRYIVCNVKYFFKLNLTFKFNYIFVIEIVLNVDDLIIILLAKVLRNRYISFN